MPWHLLTLLALAVTAQPQPATKTCGPKNWHFAFGKCHEERDEEGGAVECLEETPLVFFCFS